MRIAVVGATGEVGRMMMRVLLEHSIPVDRIELYGSRRSSGSGLTFRGMPIPVRMLQEDSFSGLYDAILFSAGSQVARKYAPIAAENTPLVVDNSSAFRQDADVPLVVPEINGHLLEGYRGIVANPNCSTIQLVLPLRVIDRLFGLQQVIVSTYQAVSGAGHGGISTMEAQRNGIRDKGVFPVQIDRNLIPQIGEFDVGTGANPDFDKGYCEEELKMRRETRKILGLDNLRISATTVRVPVMYGHCESVYCVCRDQVNLSALHDSLDKAPSVQSHARGYVTPLHLNDSEDSHVSRLRMGTDAHSLTFWSTGHNVRLGAATNAVRIMELYKKQGSS